MGGLRFLLIDLQIIACLCQLLQELSRLCNIIVEPLRDRIVTSLLQASLVCSLSSAFSHKSILNTETFYWNSIFSGGLTSCNIRWGPITTFHPGWWKTIGRRFRSLKGMPEPFECWKRFLSSNFLMLKKISIK